MDKTNRALLHPVGMRIVQQLAVREEATARDLQEAMPDVPKTTLYRHLNELVSVQLATVIRENRVRGTLERVYSLNTQQLQAENSLENAPRNAFSFLMKIYADFDRFFGSSERSVEAERLFLNNVILMLSDTEFDELLRSMQSLLLEFFDRPPSQDRRPRSLSIISAPVESSDFRNMEK